MQLIKYNSNRRIVHVCFSGAGCCKSIEIRADETYRQIIIVVDSGPMRIISKVIFASLLIITLNLILHIRYISEDDFTAYNNHKWKHRNKRNKLSKE